MAHNIEYNTYPITSSQESILADIIDIVLHSGDRYGTDSIKFDNVNVFESENAAYEHIRKIDKAFYGGYAVKYYDLNSIKDSAKVAELRTRISENLKKKEEYIKAHSVKLQKAAYIGCPTCGSKLNKERLWSNQCPLCRTDLRSKTVLDRIESFDKKNEDLNKKIEEEKLKSKKKATIKWLVKYEYHS